MAAAPANEQPEVEIIENPAGPQPAAVQIIQQREVVANPLFIPPAETVPHRGWRGGTRVEGNEHR